MDLTKPALNIRPVSERRASDLFIHSLLIYSFVHSYTQTCTYLSIRSTHFTRRSFLPRDRAQGTEEWLGVGQPRVSAGLACPWDVSEVLADPRHSAGPSGVRVQVCAETRALTH